MYQEDLVRTYLNYSVSVFVYEGKGLKEKVKRKTDK